MSGPTINLRGVDLEERRERNLFAFRQKFPEVTQKLDALSPQTELRVHDDGSFDIYFQDKAFFGGDAAAYAAEKLSAFFETPTRIALDKIEPTSFDSYAGRVMKNVLDAAEEENIQFSPNRKSTDSYYVCLFGLGLGLHIEELADTLRARNILIQEPNLELVFHSVTVLDWFSLLQKLQDNNVDLFLLPSNNDNDFAEIFRYRTRVHNPCALDGVSIFQLYKSPFLEKSAYHFRENMRLYLSGLGFFYDENLMISNTCTNLKSGRPRIFTRRYKNKDNIPVFLIGSGPSLSNDLETIKEQQNNALIVSCGTALMPLLRAGVRPDIHIELENLDVDKTINYAAGEFDLSDIVFLGPVTVDLKIKGIFKRCVYFFRQGLSPFALFSNDVNHTLEDPDPTVANAALSFLQSADFRKIYMFGVDMGKKGQRHHHGDVYHYSKDAPHWDPDFSIELPGNFGGRAYTFHGLFWARDSLQRAINRYKRCKVFNCSDGVYVNGATAKLGGGLDLAPLDKDKSEVTNDIVESFGEFTEEMFAACWNVQETLASLETLAGAYKDAFRNAGHLDGPDFQVKSSALLLEPKEGLELFAAMMTRGTYHMMNIGADYYMSRVEDSQRERLRELFVNEACAVIDLMTEKARINFEALDRGEILDLSAYNGEDIFEGAFTS